MRYTIRYIIFTMNMSDVLHYKGVERVLSYRIMYYLRGFKILAKGYWTSEKKWQGIGILSVVIVLNLLSVFLTVLINDWYKEFWDVLQSYQFDQFWYLVGKFSLIALIYISIGVYSVYLQQMLQIKWREWMTDRYLVQWLKNRAYYRLKLAGNDMDNPDQRISEDINQFVALTLSLSIGMLRQLISLVAFVVILWNLSGILTVPIGSYEFTIYGYMVWVSLVYSIAGTYLTHKVGRLLINLNFEQQKYEADFRFSMMRVRENAESIAFYRGEKPEFMGFGQRFKSVIKNFRDIMTRTKILNAFTVGYGQLAIIIPIFMAAPRWFAMEVQVGWIMQLLNAFGKVQEAMSYLVDSYANIAQWCSVIRRLEGFDRHIGEAVALKSEVDFVCGDDVKLDDVDVYLPNGDILVKSCSLDMQDKHSLLIMGQSGVGKSTMLRTLAGIWPYAKGQITLPSENKFLFLPQKPYLPLGSLRRAIYYPLVEDKTQDDKLKEILIMCQLGKLVNKLDEVDDWSRILSLGEQQRLAFARVLLYKPQYVFLDEATSATDEALEQYLYSMLIKELPKLKIISIGHRASLMENHEYKLTLYNEGKWSLEKL